MPSPKIPRKDSRDFHRLCFDAGRWFQFPKSLFRLRASLGLDYGPILMLAFLINYHYRIEDGRENNPATGKFDGWFYCRSSTITEQLGLTADAQNKLLRQLARSGLVASKRGGMPPKRYLKIDFDALLAAVS